MTRSGHTTWVRVGVDDVLLGEMWVPRRVRVESIGTDGSPDLFAEFEILDGAPECISIRWARKGAGRGVRTSDLQGVTSLDNFAINAFMRHAAPFEGSLVGERAATDAEHWARISTLRDAVATRTRGANREELEQVARIYRENVTGSPTAAVQRAMSYSRRTALRRVQAARAEGLIPPRAE